MIDVTDAQVVKGPGDRQHVAFVQVDIHHLPIYILQLAHLQKQGLSSLRIHAWTLTPMRHAANCSDSS